MKLRTELQASPLPHRIEATDPLFLVGSCFTEHIGQWLESCWLPVCCNPWGVLFNPASIAQSLHRLLDTKPYCPTLEQQGSLFCSFDHHGSFSTTNREETLQKIEAAEAQAQAAFRQSKHVLITFGTAWVFETDGRIVANCHKFPASRFTRRRLTPQEIVQAWAPILEATPQKQYIFNVSPIRHLADGLHGNQLSKSTLLLAIDTLQELYPQQVAYLPTYELLIDDLRDYRFYADDLVHPSALAIQAVKELFIETAAARSLQQYLQKAEPIVKALQHKPSDAESEAYRKFLADTLQKKEALLATLRG